MKVPEPKKTKSGWRIQLRLGGKSIPVIAADRKSCIRAAAQIKAKMQAGEQMEAAVSDSVESVILKYIHAKEAVLSPSTIRAYYIMYRNRWQSIRSRKISDIRPEEWQKIISIESTTCAPKTLRNAWGLLRSAAKSAGITIADATLPQKEKNSRSFLSASQIPVFVDAVKDTPFAIPLLLALSSLRISEISALTWENVGNDMIRVSGATVLGADNKYHTKKTNKNFSSARTVPIFIPELRIALNRSRLSSGPVVACSQNAIRRNLKKICAEAGLPELTVHGLRHSFASLAYHLQIPEKICMEIGGWSDNQTMRNIYTHIAQEDISHYGSALHQFFENRA